MLITCPLLTDYLFITYSQLVHTLFVTCSWVVNCLSTTCPRLVRDLLVTCSWVIHELLMTCTRLVHCPQIFPFLIMTPSLIKYIWNRLKQVFFCGLVILKGSGLFVDFICLLHLVVILLSCCVGSWWLCCVGLLMVFRKLYDYILIVVIDSNKWSPLLWPEENTV